MKVKCKVSVEVPRASGGFKQYQAGTVYDVSDLEKSTIKAYFEHPTLAPSKKMQTRVTEASAGEDS